MDNATNQQLPINMDADLAVDPLDNGVAGRICPVSYGYGLQVFQRSPDIVAETLYVIGGLYGNPYALDAVDALVACETQSGPQPHLVFNGDFHWFDIDASVFEAISNRVLKHTALRGNVETELAGEDNTFGCGCAYPDSVSDDEVARSNRILVQLRDTARSMPVLRRMLGELPMHALVQVGGARVGIVHGDANTLAGWDFAQNRLCDPTNNAAFVETLRCAHVDVFASSHTCAPVLRRFNVDGRMRAIINNGAAGMPNFTGTQFPPKNKSWSALTKKTLATTLSRMLTIRLQRVGKKHQPSYRVVVSERRSKVKIVVP